VAISNEDLDHLGRCVELARSAYEAGDEPFGSLLLDGDGETRFEDRNQVAGGDATRHPEFAIARWAASNLSLAERVRATVYTSGEHCPMCSAAHAWVGLGRIVYATSAEQLTTWRGEWERRRHPLRHCPFRRSRPASRSTGPRPSWRMR
jgi:tRNA(Arg) A34 adenosine deaminase TadA